MDPIRCHELKAIIEQDEDVLVINVLPRAAYEREHIPGSISAPIDAPDFVEQVRRQSTGSSQRIVPYCAGPRCDASRRAAQILSEQGFSAVSAYEGGIEEWRQQGHPLITGVAAL